MNDMTQQDDITQRVLTDDEIRAVWVEHGLDDEAVEDFARAIESALLSKLRALVADERAAFDAWFLAHPLNRSHHNDTTQIDDAFMPFQAWQARAALASAPVAGEAQERIEQMAVNRYRPVPDSKFSYKVVAGDGSRSLYTGTKDSCLRVAAKLTEAFLDGAFVASDASPQSSKDGEHGE
ncbi:hypothetical protein [Achromobacter ruhlandii]|uniref:hypothetical protein n=1 Tax=Achromobacter ruhlandii TaxID=72557 RepID=UPI0007BEA9AC|nr:hypothetical protein [Achromobacter ruhlandii]